MEQETFSPKIRFYAKKSKRTFSWHLLLTLLPLAAVILHVAAVELEDLIGIVVDRDLLCLHLRAKGLAQGLRALL